MSSSGQTTVSVGLDVYSVNGAGDGWCLGHCPAVCRGVRGNGTSLFGEGLYKSELMEP